MHKGGPAPVGLVAGMLLALSCGGDRDRVSPVDYIWFVDNSGSMAEELTWLDENLAAFGEYLEENEVDYHIVMLAAGGGNAPATTVEPGESRPPADATPSPQPPFLTKRFEELCFPPPISGPACGDSRRYRHIRRNVGSTDGLWLLADAYDAYEHVLRSGVRKVFVAVTDDNSGYGAKWFEQQMACLDPTIASGGFVFHSIVSYGDADSRDYEYGRSIGSQGCDTGMQEGEVYLELSARTSGGTVPVCERDWSRLFGLLTRRRPTRRPKLSEDCGNLRENLERGAAELPQP